MTTSITSRTRIGYGSTAGLAEEWNSRGDSSLRVEIPGSPQLTGTIRQVRAELVRDARRFGSADWAAEVFVATSGGWVPARCPETGARGKRLIREMAMSLEATCAVGAGASAWRYELDTV